MTYTALSLHCWTRYDDRSFGRNMSLNSSKFELLLIGERPTIRGECDAANARDIEAWLGRLDTEPLEVDLSGVTFFDSSALRAFLNMRRCNRHLRLVNPSRTVRNVLDITGTTEYLVDGRDIFS
jgi:anti-anti-sigma factor